MKEFLLESLRELQDSLLLLMERAARANVPEAGALGWTLNDVITAYRELRDDRIGWQAALRVYQVASNIQLDCDMAVLDANGYADLEWQYCKYLVSR